MNVINKHICIKKGGIIIEPGRKAVAECTARKSRRKYSLFRIAKIVGAVRFTCRIKGGHFIYTHSDVEEILNIQPKGNKAKPYQVKQVRDIILRYHLGGDL